MPKELPRPKPTAALQIALGYAVVGALWILFSGEVLHRTVEDGALAARIENLKGWFFVGVTASLLWLTLDRYFRQLRRTGELLSASDKRWRTAVEAAGDGVWDWDKRTDRVFFSARWKSMLGYAPDEIGDSLAEWDTRVHPEDKPRVMAEVARLLSGETRSYASEHRLRCKDGSYRWVLDRGSVQERAPDGAVVRVVGTHTDIHARKLVELALRASEARYRGLFEAETDAVLLVDQISDAILDVNPAALALYGYTREEMLALKSTQLSTEPEMSRAAIARRERFVALRLHRRKDGSIFPIEASRCYFELDGRAVHVAAFRDLSERHRAQTALQESEERLRSLGDNLPESYIYQAVNEPDGRRHFTHVSAGVERVHGVTATEVIQDAGVLLGAIEPAYVAAFNAAVDKSARELSDFDLALEMRHPTRGTCVIHLRSRPHRTETGQVIWDGVATDITEGRRIAAERRRWADAFEHCAHGLGIVDAPGSTIIAGNPALMQLLGRSAAEVVGVPAQRLFPGIEHHGIESCLATSDREGRAHCEGEVVRGDGSTFSAQMDVVTVRDAGGRAIYRVVSVQDITARRAALDAMLQRLELQDQLAKVSETVPGVIFSFRRRPDGTFCLPFATPAFEELFGVSAHQAREDFAPAMAHVHAEDRARLVDSISVSASTLRSWRHAFRVLHPRRGEIWLEGNSVPRRESDGSILWHGFVQDVTERKRVDMAIREREQQLQLFVEHSPAAIAMLDRDMRYLVVSRRWLADYRLGERELRGLSHYEVFPEIPERVKDVHRRCLAGAVESCEADPFPRADGTVDWVRWEVRPWRDAGGAVGGLIVFSEVITDRIHAQQALAAEATRRRILIEGSSDGIVVLDELGAVTEANPRAAEMLGYTCEEMRRLHVWDWDRDWPPERVRDLFAGMGHEGVRFETRHLRKDGSEFDVELSANLGDVGGRRLVFCVCRDITARKRAESEIRQSEQRFRTLVESAPIGVFVQTHGRFSYVNEAGAALFGATRREEMIGREVLERFHASVRMQVLERIRQLNVERKVVPPAVERCLRLDGREFEGEFSAVPLEFDGSPGALVFFQDVTARRQLESELRQSQKLEGIGQLAGGVAHDFNNILAAMLMHVGVLRMGTAADAGLQAGLRELEGHVQRAAGLTRQLLMFSRRSVMAMVPLNINEVATNLLKMLRRLVGETIELRFEPDDALPPVEADGGMLDQVIVNLVVNARDAMPGGGTFVLRTSVCGFGPGDVAAHPDRRTGRFVCLAASDTGCGMTPEVVKRIFEPFYTTKEPGKGTGLGLATVHGIIKQHKGWVEVESAPGRGSTFRVYLPALSRVSDPLPMLPDTGVVRKGDEGVLLVEDDAVLRELTAQAMRLLGYRVFEAGTGKQAMQLWPQCAAEVDIVVTDMVMPEGMTGLELTERLQAAKPGVKVIITSGYSAEIARTGVPNRPGILYLPKPVDVRTLTEAVGRLIGAGRHAPP